MISPNGQVNKPRLFRRFLFKDVKGWGTGFWETRQAHKMRSVFDETGMWVCHGLPENGVPLNPLVSQFNLPFWVPFSGTPYANWYPITYPYRLWMSAQHFPWVLAPWVVAVSGQVFKCGQYMSIYRETYTEHIYIYTHTSVLIVELRTPAMP